MIVTGSQVFWKLVRRVASMALCGVAYAALLAADKLDGPLNGGK